MFVIYPIFIQKQTKNLPNPQPLSSSDNDKEKSLLEGFLLPMFVIDLKRYQEMWQH